MHARHETPSAADLAADASSLTAGLGILTMTFFPFALPGLLLALPFVLPLVLLLLVGGVVYLLARALLLPVRLARKTWRARAARRDSGSRAIQEVPRTSALTSASARPAPTGAHEARR